MREIKFRGKRIDNGEWVYGCYDQQAVSHNGTPDHTPIKHLIRWHGKYTDGVLQNLSATVYQATVGQFTGLKDENGVEIYEGDIAERWDGLIRQVKYGRYLGAVCLAHLGFYFECVSGDISGIDGTFKVIGNIHDNPELLEQQ